MVYRNPSSLTMHVLRLFGNRTGDPFPPLLDIFLFSLRNPLEPEAASLTTPSDCGKVCETGSIAEKDREDDLRPV